RRLRQEGADREAVDRDGQREAAARLRWRRSGWRRLPRWWGWRLWRRSRWRPWRSGGPRRVPRGRPWWAGWPWWGGAGGLQSGAVRSRDEDGKLPQHQGGPEQSAVLPPCRGEQSLHRDAGRQSQGSDDREAVSSEIADLG